MKRMFVESTSAAIADSAGSASHRRRIALGCFNDSQDDEAPDALVAIVGRLGFVWDRKSNRLHVRTMLIGFGRVMQ